QQTPLLLEVLCNGRRLQALVDSGASHSVCDRGALEKIGEKAKETQFSATMVDGTKLPIHGETSLQLHIGALRWKPKLPVTSIKGLDFILGRDFLKRFNPEIDWINSKVCIYNNGKRIALRSWTDAGDVPETTLARFEQTVNESNTVYLALVMAAAEEEKPSSELPAAVKEVLEQYKDIMPDDLPAGVAPARTHEHEIVEEPGAKPTTDPPIHLSLRCTSSLYSKTRRQFTDVHRLPRTEQTDSKKQIPHTAHRRLTGPTAWCNSPLEAGPTIGLLADQDGGQLDPQDGVPYSIRLLRILGDAVRTLQRTSNVPSGNEPYSTAPAGRVRSGVPGRYPHLLQEHEGACGASAEGVRDPAEKNFYVKLSKSDFALKKVLFLGHMVSPEGIHVDPRKIEAVKKWKVPENMKELQQFLGFTNYYNRFVPQYAKIAAPLTDLLKKYTPFKWDTPHQQAMEQLQTALTTTPVLILPDPEKDYVVEADASDQAVGAVLMQDHGNGLQPIAYLSKKLHGTELNYPIHNKEALAIVVAFKAWRCYLEGAKTTIYTDHCSLKYLKSQPTLSRRQVRWVDFLETHFHYDIIYKPGLHNKADALSRPGHVAGIQLDGMNPLLKGLFQHGYSVDGEIATAGKQKLLQWEKDLAE
ncbi:unnamed protein product, partial [Closterium sp. NIES-53]